MRRIHHRWLIGVLLIVGVGLAACGPSAEETQAAAEQTEYEAIQQLKEELDQKRAELDELRQRAVAAAAETATEAEQAVEEGAEAVAESADDLVAQAQQLEAEVVEAATNMGQRLVKFINESNIVPGEPMTETQLGAVRMKSDEDIVLAGEYIEKGGDYKRAIRIYEDALLVDSDNEKLKAALAEAEELRFMSAERLASVKKGMTQDDVRAAIGQVNLRNIREYPDREVVAWFYPTADDGSAAGVYYRKAKSGEMTVYRIEYSAVPGGGDQG